MIVNENLGIFGFINDLSTVINNVKLKKLQERQTMKLMHKKMLEKTKKEKGLRKIESYLFL